jgi:transposase
VIGSRNNPQKHVWRAGTPSRVTFHFTPTSCSWANAVEGWFAKLTRQRLKRGVFTSIVELQTGINRFIAEANDKPKPFVWTKSADAILAAVQRGRQALETIHWKQA